MTDIQQDLDAAKEKAIKKVEHAGDEAKESFLETAKRVEIETKLEVSKDNHEQIMKVLGGMDVAINELVRRVGVQNGRVGKAEEKYYELDGNISKHNAEVLRLYNEKNDVIQKMYDFMNETKKKKEASDSLVGRFKENLLMLLATFITGMLVNKFGPLAFPFLQKLFT